MDAYGANETMPSDEPTALNELTPPETELVETQENVAKIGDIEYATLDDAVAAAQDGDTIVLSQDVNLESNVIIDKGVGNSITLDLNGFSLIGNNKDQLIVIKSGNVTIQNGTLTDGKSAGKGDEGSNGGAIYAYSRDGAKHTLTVKNCTFTENSSNMGSALWTNSSLVMENCTIQDNGGSSNDGSAVAVKGPNTNEIADQIPSVTITGCTFANNKSESSGVLGVALYLLGVKEIHVSEGSFTGNGSGATGGAVYYSHCNTADFTEVTFTRNTTKSASGGGAVYADNVEKLSFGKCTFTNNIAEGGTGGAIFSSTGNDLYIIDCEFTGNQATGFNGGAIVHQGGPAVIKNSTFTKNTAASMGGAILVNEWPVVPPYTTTLTLEGCSITDNKAGYGGGVAVQGIPDAYDVTGAIKNTSITDNASTYYGGGIYLAYADIHVDANVTNNTTTYYGGGVAISYGGTLTLADGATVCNNTAAGAGDDLYSLGMEGYPAVIHLATASGILPSGQPITGWYVDGLKEGAATDRWSVNDYYDAYTLMSSETDTSLALKAAHGKLIQPGAISGTVFNDEDRDNVFDNNEATFANQPLTLWQQDESGAWTQVVDADENPVTATTNANGAYAFTELEPGTYQVRLAARPSGMNRDCGLITDAQGNKFESGNGYYATAALEIKDGEAFIANAGFYYRSSGGGGGGSTPSTPIEDDPTPLAPGLNRDDHYAYIVGYPEDYVTGEPTDDMSRWPVKPQDNISREEVATIFFRLLDDASRAEAWTTSNSFPDVASDRWSNNAISTAENAGIISGYTDGSFRPGNKITRAEFATIAAQFDDLDYDGEDMFSDISGHWANQYINRAAKKGWIHGYPDGTFRPDQYITRAEAMTLINAVLERVPDADHMLDDMNKWPDNMNTSAWYYAQVQEATNSHDYEDRTDPTESEVWTEIIPTRDWKALEDPSNYEYLESDAGDVM